MLWEYEPLASVSTAFDRNTENMFSISFRKYRDEKKKQLVYFDHGSRHVTSTAAWLAQP